ncbi:MAG: hypothetical protein F6K10_17290 [Moorea sp. SIO2B7]|nr:hypothetical protein [Moorena sp. SIO2B7]
MNVSSRIEEYLKGNGKLSLSKGEKIMLSPFVQRKLALAFYKYDQSKNGSLEKEDLLIIAKRIAASFAFKEDDSKYQEILKTYSQVWDYYLAEADQDGDGKVSLIDFFEVRDKMASSQVKQNQDINKLMFDCLDVDGSGTISFQEYKVYLNALGETNEEIIKRGFESIDVNKDGSISRDEYAKIRSDYGTLDDPEDPSKWFYGTF